MRKVQLAWHPVMVGWPCRGLFSLFASAQAARGVLLIVRQVCRQAFYHVLLLHVVEHVTEGSGVGLRNGQTPAGFAEVLGQQQTLYDARPRKLLAV